MAILSSMVGTLSNFYPDMAEKPLENLDQMVARILSKIRTIAASPTKNPLAILWSIPGMI